MLSYGQFVPAAYPLAVAIPSLLECADPRIGNALDRWQKRDSPLSENELRSLWDPEEISVILTLGIPDADAVKTCTDALTDAAMRIEERRRQQAVFCPDPTAEPRWLGMSFIREESIDWIVRGWIPANSITIVEGRAGVGKSTVVTSIAAAVTRGEDIPIGAVTRLSRDEAGDGPRGRAVIVVSGEEHLPSVTVPRLRVAGAVPDLVTLSSGGAWLLDEPGLAELETVIQTVEAAMVVIDPVRQFSGVDGDKEDQVRVMLGALAGLARRTHVAIVLVRHWRKMTGDAAERGAGSVAWHAAARSVVCVGRHNHQTIWAAVKNNAMKLAQSWSFEILAESDESPPAIRWGDVVDVTADDMALRDSHRRRSGNEGVQSIVREILRAGSEPATSVIDQCIEVTGVNKRTVGRAAKDIGVKISRDNGTIIWSL